MLRDGGGISPNSRKELIGLLRQLERINTFENLKFQADANLESKTDGTISLKSKVPVNTRKDTQHFNFR